MQAYTARDVMNEKVIWVEEDSSLSEAVGILSKNHITGAPVVNSNHKMTGVISLRDFIQEGELIYNRQLESERAQTVYYEQSFDLPLEEDEVKGFHVGENNSLRVKDIMTPIVFNADVNTPVSELASTMHKGRIHRMIILQNDELAGIVTTMDMLKLLYEET